MQFGSHTSYVNPSDGHQTDGWQNIHVWRKLRQGVVDISVAIPNCTPMLLQEIERIFSCLGNPMVWDPTFSCML